MKIEERFAEKEEIPREQVNQVIQDMELEEAMQALRYSNERYRIAAENSSEIILDYDIVTDTMYHATKRVEDIYGIPQKIENAPEYFISSGAILPQSVDSYREAFRKIRAGVPQVSCVIKTRTKDGTELWDEMILTTVYSADGRPIRAIGVLKDINQQMEAEFQYKKEALYRNVVQKYALISYEADLTNGTVISGLENFLQQVGEPFVKSYDRAFELLLEHVVWPEDREMTYANFCIQNLLNKYHEGCGKVEGEYRRIEQSQAYWVRCTVYLTYDRELDIVHAFYYIYDIHDAKTETIQLQEKAELDLLTGVYNKVTAEQMIRASLDRGTKNRCTDAFLIVDLDEFKKVNDQLGHAFGDVVLFETAQNLKSLCRAGDIVGRIGGDEFVMFLKDLPDEMVVETKGLSICAMFQNAYAGALKDHKVSGTVGISLSPRDGQTFEELYEKADIALYHAKAIGKDTYCLYDEGMENDVGKRDSHMQTDEQPKKVFKQNIIEYIFQILYESRNLEQAISAVIELVAKHYGFGRAYIYELSEEEDCLKKIYEWSHTNTNPLPLEVNAISDSLFENYKRRFAEDRIFVRCSEESLFPEELACDTLKDVQLRVQFAMGGSEELLGMVGFDKYLPCRNLNHEELIELQAIAQMLDSFLTERRHNNKLQKSSAMLQAIADSQHTCTYIIDPETHTLQFVNQNTRIKIPKAVPGAVCYEVIRGKGKPCGDCPFIQMKREEKQELNTEMYLEPYCLWAKIHAKMIRLDDGKEYGLFDGYEFTKYKDESGAYIVDADAFTRDVALYRALCKSTDDYIFVCDMPKNLFYFPKPMVEEFNLPGQVIEDVIPLWSSLIHESERQNFLDNMSDIFNNKCNYHNLEYRVQNKSGKWVWLKCRGYMEHDEHGDPALFAGVITNLGKKSKIDYLSGLPNKYEFELHVRAALAENHVRGELMLLGLDNFRNINNLYGWDYGDRVIHETAQKLQNRLPEKIQVYRLDSDCFGIYFGENSEIYAKEAYQIIGSEFDTQQEFGEHKYFSTLSAGYAQIGEEPVSFNTLFKQAEFALEYSKLEGKNRLSRYDSTTMGDKERVLTMIEHLRESVEHGCNDFELYFQPQMNTSSKVIKSAEVLLRWNREEYGVVSPTEFIPLLEESGLIHQVGRWILIHASEVCREWRIINPDFILNVNISFAQLQDQTFIPYLEKAIRENLINPVTLHLELTESCIAAGSSSLTVAFEKLRNLGFSIEMDDFGTGYSSLEILKNAPADVVKIDRAFVTDITKSSFDATFIEFVVALCHSVNIQVCLEGVETWEEYRMVEKMAVDMIQGFLFGTPQTKSDFENRYLQNIGMEQATTYS